MPLRVFPKVNLACRLSRLPFSGLNFFSEKNFGAVPKQRMPSPWFQHFLSRPVSPNLGLKHPDISRGLQLAQGLSQMLCSVAAASVQGLSPPYQLAREVTAWQGHPSLVWPSWRKTAMCRNPLGKLYVPWYPEEPGLSGPEWPCLSYRFTGWLCRTHFLNRSQRTEILWTVASLI